MDGRNSEFGNTYAITKSLESSTKTIYYENHSLYFRFINFYFRDQLFDLHHTVYVASSIACISIVLPGLYSIHMCMYAIIKPQRLETSTRFCMHVDYCMQRCTPGGINNRAPSSICQALKKSSMPLLENHDRSLFWHPEDYRRWREVTQLNKCK